MYWGDLTRNNNNTLALAHAHSIHFNTFTRCTLLQPFHIHTRWFIQGSSFEEERIRSPTLPRPFSHLLHAALKLQQKLYVMSYFKHILHLGKPDEMSQLVPTFSLYGLGTFWKLMPNWTLGRALDKEPNGIWKIISAHIWAWIFLRTIISGFWRKFRPSLRMS